MEEREEKLKNIKELGCHPYKTAKFSKEDINNIIEKHQNLEKGEEVKDSVSVAGRIMALRSHGKTTFVDIKDETGKIQLYINKKTLGEKYFSLFENVDIGDIIGVKGPIFKTKMGELSIGVKELTVLAKSFNSLPVSSEDSLMPFSFIIFSISVHGANILSQATSGRPFKIP